MFYAVTIVLVLIANYIVTRTRKGRYFTAVENIFPVLRWRIPAAKTKILAYVICGVMAAAAGWFMIPDWFYYTNSRK